MLTDTYPLRDRHRTAGAMLWALATGVSGVVANLLLILFFLLASPFSDATSGLEWLGTASDIVVIVQFATFVPVAWYLRHRLPATRPVWFATAAAVVAMVAAAVLHVLLVAGVLGFDVQVLFAMASFLVVYVWVFTISSAGHRAGALPRPVTRLGLLVGASYPVGLLIVAPGLLFPWGSLAQLAFVVPGIVIGSIGWLALPLWPLLLARLVLGRHALDNEHAQKERTS